MLGDIWSIGERALGGGADDKLFTDVQKAVGEASEAAGGLLAAKADKSPPKEIQALRDAFEETLEELGVTLVVLIDDLDRCLPPTTISTLEAKRLFLFLKHTASVIAADTDMLKHPVRKHFTVRDAYIDTNF